MVVSSRGEGELRQNDVHANWGPGIAVCIEGRATIERNRIHHGLEAGVLVSSSDAVATIDGNDIFANERPGVVILSHADPTVRGNRIYDGRENGVWVYEHGRGQLLSNEIFNNAEAEISIANGGAPLVKGNIIQHDEHLGVDVGDAGAGALRGNQFFGEPTMHVKHAVINGQLKSLKNEFYEQGVRVSATHGNTDEDGRAARRQRRHLAKEGVTC